MLRRKVTGSASFVCLRCRLQLAGNGAAGAGAVARRPPVSSPRTTSALAALGLRSLTRSPSRYYSTNSGEARAEHPNDNETTQSTKDPCPSPTAPTDTSEAGSATMGGPSLDDTLFDWDMWDQKSSSRAVGAREDDFAKVFEANKVTENSSKWNAFDFNWGEQHDTKGRTERSESEAISPEDGAQEVSGGVVNGLAARGPSSRRQTRRAPRHGSMITYTSLSSDPKIWSTREGLVTAQTEGIAMEFMGSPAEAIVLRERSRKEYPPIRPLILPEMDSETMTRAAIDEAELLANRGMRGSASDEETLLHIHELQPSMRVLPEADFTALRRTLVDGFTKVQLELYIEHWNLASKLRNKDDEGKDVSQPPWVLDHRPWVPAVEDAVEDVEPKLLGYIQKGMTPKARLAMKVMRLCWELSPRELYDKPGYLDVKLRDVEFKLLALGGKKWIKRIMRLYMGEGMQLEMFRQSHWISIRAPKHAAHWILDNINQVLEGTVSAQFSKDFICPGPLVLSEAAWEKLSTMTSSVARLDPTGEKVVVTWVQLQEPDDTTEDPGEHVLRLLSYAFRPEPRVSRSLLISPPSPSQGGRYLPEVGCEDKLPWQERAQKWTRWTGAASTTRSNSTPSVTSSIPVDFLPFPIEPIQRRTEYVAGQRRRGWSTKPLTDTSATFGHVLFEQQQGEGVLVPSSPPTSSTPRSFAAVLPPIRNIRMPSNLMETGLWHTVTVMRFVPAPDLPPELLAYAPALELRIEANHREVKRINDLRAVMHHFIGDVAFPEAFVDVRLQQNRYFLLDGADVEHFAAPIIEFLGDSHIRPMEGRFATPPSLNGMRLPRSFFTGKIAVDGGPNDMIEIDYMYAGIEIQRHVTSEHQRLKVHYTNIAGGWRRGNRSELSLDAQLVDVDVSAGHQSASSPNNDQGADGLDRDGTDLGVDMSPVLDVAGTIEMLMESDASKRAAEDIQSNIEEPFDNRLLGEAEYLKTVEDIATGMGGIAWLGGESRAKKAA
ncbi:mitochondrial inner-membrane-bound regulator-domain-containing protein [Podospora australis]|uniref:Mitochondrial inner-membrane-bound regulator-domain-containing protein n=1 Tax=Podospora australis TaxID=1536484 RepID=A0AAN7AKW2_9PEZI|nr:mitochondrial inner-membrane-bound regulator-domain-containing protein [Podospora australis]